MATAEHETVSLPSCLRPPELALICAHLQTLWLQLVGSFLSLSFSLHTHPSSEPPLLWAPACHTEVPACQRLLRIWDLGQVLGMDTYTVCSPLHPGGSHRLFFLTLREHHCGPFSLWQLQYHSLGGLETGAFCFSYLWSLEA